MAVPTQWKIAGAALAAGGLGVGGLLGFGGSDDPARADRITLRDAGAVTADPAPTTAAPTTAGAADLSPDGESIDSPLQSADDSPFGEDSVLTPDPTPPPTTAAPAPPPPPPPPTPAPQPSYDSPDDSPAPRPAPAPRPSYDSPDGADSASADSPDSADSAD